MTTKHPESSDTRCQLRFADGRRCALPAHPQGDGLCCPHAHALHRRLRPSDLTRELITPRGTLVAARKIRRILTKLPIAVAEGLFSPREAGALTSLCNLMLSCNREARANPFLESILADRRILASLLAEGPEQGPVDNLVVNADANENENNAQISPVTANR
jgi:hypothetical protein